MTAVQTGGNTSITLGTTGASTIVTARWRSIGGHTETGAEVDNTDLTTTGYSEVVPGDLVDPGEFEFLAIFDPTKATTLPLANSAAETVTITRTGGTGASTLIGTGFIKALKHPDHAQNEPLLATVTIRWDGKTGPAHTP